MRRVDSRPGCGALRVRAWNYTRGCPVRTAESLERARGGNRSAGSRAAAEGRVMKRPSGEEEMIRGFVARWGDAAAGIGDDAAILDVPAGEKLVISTDA